MINKIKDFLKNKLGKRPPVDLPEEDSSVVDLDTNTQLTNPFLKLKTTQFNFKNLFRKTRTMKLPSMKKDDGGGAGGPLLSPSLSKFVEKFFSRSSREPIHQFFLVVLICGFTWTAGKIAALALKGQPTFSAPREYALDINLEKDFDPGVLGQVRSINPFRTNVAGGGKKKVAELKCDEATRASNLREIKLMNTVVLQDEVKSIASVQLSGERNLIEVRQGDKISNLAEVFKINRLSIIIKNIQENVCEYISNEKGFARGGSPISIMSPAGARQFKAEKKMAGIENVGNKFNIKKSLLDEKMKDLQAILTQARGIPITNPDGTMAFKIVEIDPSGIFSYLGIQDGDIITSINGKPIYSLNEVMNLFGRIRNLDQLSLGIKRDGTDSTQEYSIKK